MTPRFRRTLAELLDAEGVPEANKLATKIVKALKADPDVVVKWMIHEELICTVGFVNEDKPAKVNPVPLTRNSIPVYKQGGSS